MIFAVHGICTLLRTQPNARIHLVATVVVVSAGFALSVSATEWCLLVLAMGLVWTAEALNTAIEFVVDLISPEQHVLAGQAKDVAAGATLLAAIAAAIIGAIVFVPRIW
jgi:diacylglycerol kinase